MTISVQCDTAGRRSVLKPSFARLGRQGVCPYVKTKGVGPYVKKEKGPTIRSLLVWCAGLPI